jgi:uncharacterized membrane protein
MDASHVTLGLATVAFVGGHFVLSSGPVRGRAVALIGEAAFRGAYSILVAAALVWMVDSYRFATDARLWTVGVFGPPILYACMFLASIFLACSLTPSNPTLAGLDDVPPTASSSYGIFAVVRHPMLASFALWSGAHLVVRGDVAGLIFFGGFFVLSTLGMVHIDARRRAAAKGTGAAGWAAFEAATSRIPFLALIRGRARFRVRELGPARIVAGIVLFVGFLFGHGPVIGLYLTPP